MSVYLYLYLYLHLYLYLYLYLYAYAYVFVHVYVHVCTRQCRPLDICTAFHVKVNFFIATRRQRSCLTTMCVDYQTTESVLETGKPTDTEMNK